MVKDRNWLWQSLEKWSATVFLLAGGLSLVGVILSVGGALMSVSMQGPSSVAVFAGVVLSFVALLGLYPRLAKRVPQLARVGILLILFPLIFTFVLLIWHSPELVGVHVPSLLMFLPSPEIVYGATFLLTSLGLAVFGVGGLRTGAFSATVSGILLVLAGAWLFLVVAASIYGFPIPQWVVNVQGGIMGVALLSIGYLWRTATTAAEHETLTPDSTT